MAKAKRTIPLPADLDEQVVTAARLAEVAVDEWIERALRKQVLVERGLDGVVEWEREHGEFTFEELTAARRRVDRAIADAAASDRASA